MKSLTEAQLHTILREAYQRGVKDGITYQIHADEHGNLQAQTVLDQLVVFEHALHQHTIDSV